MHLYLICHSYVIVCHPYVTRIYLYVIWMSLVCHPHVLLVLWICYTLLYDLEAKRNFFDTVCPLHWSKQFRNKLKYKSSSYTTSNYLTKLWNFVKMFIIFVNNLRQTPSEFTKTLASTLLMMNLVSANLSNIFVNKKDLLYWFNFAKDHAFKI